MIRVPVDLREMVIALAGHAGQAIMQVYGRGFEVSHKDDASPVTDADLLLNTAEQDLDSCVCQVIELLRQRSLI